ncbi:MAG TPA: glycosyltransferase family 4 protein [Flavobacterium sp.]
MKIGYLTPEYPVAEGTPSAGIGSSVRNVATALAEKGVHVTVFVYGQRLDKVLVQDGVQIHLIRKINYPVFSWYRYRKYLQKYINDHISTVGTQLIEAPDYTGITALMELNAPLVVRFHGSDAYFCKLEGRKQKLKNYLLERLAVQSADAYSSPTHFAARITSEIFNIELKRVMTIPNGIAISEFSNAGPQQFEAGMILYIGTLIRKKGVLELPGILAEVLREYPSARLVLAGSDSYDLYSKTNSTWELIKAACEPEILSKLEYLGKIPYEGISALIKQAHVCVFPTFAETQGMVTIESMAMRKAVVTSNFEWNKELIDDGVDGLLADPTHHKAFADQIVKLLSNETIRLEIASNARAKAACEFDINVIAAKNIAFYRTVIDQHNS